MADPLDIKEIIEYYFHCGYENKIILEFLAIHHGINISLSTLIKRRLREYGLRRRNLELDEQMIRNLIEIETNGPGELRHALRIKHHIHGPRQEVERIMRELNPDHQMLLGKDVGEDLDAERTSTLVQIFVGTLTVSMLMKISTMPIYHAISSD